MIIIADRSSQSLHLQNALLPDYHPRNDENQHIDHQCISCSYLAHCQADRVKAVIALSKGWSAAQVAEILLFDEKTSTGFTTTGSFANGLQETIEYFRKTSV